MKGFMPAALALLTFAQQPLHAQKNSVTKQQANAKEAVITYGIRNNGKEMPGANLKLFIKDGKATLVQGNGGREQQYRTTASRQACSCFPWKTATISLKTIFQLRGSDATSRHRYHPGPAV
ncbi:hypothetical protein MKQ70_28530 [Chitinophaga sedimenti]|uniref:hypothetical protein n=1 Tax=Chitinophaga sedimenti TaxID=2033606 RepID=UPI00200380D6|nr:hypothetical protein [Chitinophaga sedimenti]MCK7558723.1 hypothetical protein [Chitinophaga sedimenti]